MHYLLFRTEENSVRKEEKMFPLDDNSESSDDDYTKCNAVAPSCNQNKGKKKPGRKAKWSNTLLDDLVDIIVNSEYYKKRLIFMNLKNQKNADIYEKILKELKARGSKRGEHVPFTAVQLRTKFKKSVSECKKVALTVKTATGIKRLQEEKGYGAWFNQLYALVKTRDSCQPWQAIEPSACDEPISELSESCPVSTSPKSSHTDCEKEKSLFVPVKNASRKRKADDNLKEILGAVKKMTENDPMKEYLQFLREESERSRQHELKMMQLLLTSPTQTNVYQQPIQPPLAYATPLNSSNNIYMHPDDSDKTFFKL